MAMIEVGRGLSMKCERARELMSEYLEGSIDYALTATVRAHIDKCDGCRSDIKAFQRTWDLLGTLPEVEPPSDFRHDVVMKAARMQHERRKAEKQGFLGLSWDYVFGRLLPARALVIACAGALLAAVLLNVPQGIFEEFANRDHGVITAGEGFRGAGPIEASPLSAHKEEWQSRTPLSNALWVSVVSTEVSEGSSYNELILEINNKGLARDVTNRIPAQVYVLPAGKYRLSPNDQRKPMWSGNVLGESPVQLTVPAISNSHGDAAPITLLVTYQFRKMNFSKIIFIPNKSARLRSSDAFGFASGSGSCLQTRNSDLYAVLQAISQDYGKTIIANGSLDRRPTVIDLSSDRIEETLRKVMKPMDLAWAHIDEAVYVDKPFRKAEN